MPAEEEMTVDERRKYLNRMRGRYWAADRMRRGELLTEMEAVTGLHRKSLIRLVRGQVTSRGTWCTIAAQHHQDSTFIPCKWWMWLQVGASEWPCWGATSRRWKLASDES